MSKPCRATGCTEPTEGHSAYCTRHKRNLRRHGDALQEGITVAELRPYLKKVAARRARNPHSPLWDILRDRWDAIGRHARRVVADHAKGKPQVSHEVQAAHHLERTAATTEADAVIDTALALYLMHEARPKRFMSDKAFTFQLARRIRGLTEVHAGTYFDAVTGKAKRVYRDMAPRTLEAFAAPIAVAFGVAAMHLVELERRDAQKVEDERARFQQVLKELQ
jgi:hypothetical protein